MFQMLFPYEEFLKFFQCEVFDLSPRGLVNCGNRYFLNYLISICLTAKFRVAFIVGKSILYKCPYQCICFLITIIFLLQLLCKRSLAVLNMYKTTRCLFASTITFKIM